MSRCNFDKITVPDLQCFAHPPFQFVPVKRQRKRGLSDDVSSPICAESEDMKWNCRICCTPVRSGEGVFVRLVVVFVLPGSIRLTLCCQVVMDVLPRIGEILPQGVQGRQEILKAAGLVNHVRL